MPSTNTVRRVYKPIVFILCLLPLLFLAAGAFGIAGVSLGADPVARLLHELGEWALRFLVITLAVTPLRFMLGQPWLLNFRRMLGLFSFTYVLLHFLTWLILDQGLYWSGILTDIAKRPYITIGFTALLLLIPLAVTSTNKMMRRLGKRWQKLHRLIYVIVPLGVWHFYWQVKKDVTEPLIYAAITAFLLGYRYWRAQRRKQSIPA
ncbi:MAG: sulfite oxidase heme-binding subunit YedZ [Steroidobacteraceae bacterium]